MSLSRIFRSDSMKALFEDIKDVLGTQSIAHNDLCYYDDTAHLVKKVTGGATEGAKFLGAALVEVVSGKLKSPYQGVSTDASESTAGIPGPRYGVSYKAKLTVGDVLTFGLPMYLSALDAQTLQATANGAAVGIYIGKARTVVAGDEDLVKIGLNYGVSSLQF